MFFILNIQCKKVLILGSGGLKIGQAGEFDYSGSQAIKALKEEDIYTVLINPNIATVQTSKGLADKVYFLPITPFFVEKVIAKENIDGIFLSFGGQTALNCGVELKREGVLKKYNVKVLGTSVDVIMDTEDRELFNERLAEINVKYPTSKAVTDLEQAKKAANEIGFPLIIRAAFALGGLGSNFCENEEQLVAAVNTALSLSNQILVEESLKGWKEIEYEVMRDVKGNCLTIINMENFDPLGIHTGESIVVAPSQTLNDKEFQMLRRIAIDTINHLKIIGECNIQYALNPNNQDYRVIEVNARLSRSSALASKASGYPIAYVAAKLGLGYSLNEIPNPVTHTTKAFFEPAIDYITIKIPRWDIDKFRHADKHIGTSMKSVGEVMAIGRKFEEAIQKAIRMIKQSYIGLLDESIIFTDIEDELRNPSYLRIFAIAEALESGYTVNKIHEITFIDKWFLYKLENIINLENKLKSCNFENLDRDFITDLKQCGFSDLQISQKIFHTEELENIIKIRNLRKSLAIKPVIKQIDTLAGEYPAKTNYLYLTYNGNYNDIEISEEERGIIVLGSGAYSIGSSVEFDWCNVNCVQTLKKLKYRTIVINYNPETVSTDFDITDRLYFEELSIERILDIADIENPKGLIISFGGQIPNNLSVDLFKVKLPILGTSPLMIENAEDRHAFSSLLDTLSLDQPEWKELSSKEDILNFTNKVGFPVLLRPSFVISGASMKVAYDENDLLYKINQVEEINSDYQLVVSKFITGAKEIEFDAVAKDGEVIVYAISEHIENAGIHSGDATLVTPAQKLYLETVRKIKKISRKIIKNLSITGPVNIQYIAKDNKIKIIECNVRASRTFPFISKVYGINFVEVATKAIMGLEIDKISTKAFDLDYLGIKAPQFSFTRLRGADPILGVEMTSTGEVACLGEEIYETFLKSILATDFKLPINKTVLLSTGDIQSKARILPQVKKLKEQGFTIYATEGTKIFYDMNSIDTNLLHWPSENKKPNTMDFIKNKQIDLVINIPKNNKQVELSNDYRIRRIAADYNVPLVTNLEIAILLIDAFTSVELSELEVKSWDEYLE